MEKHIELWRGIYGSGKTHALIDRYNREYCNACIFIVMDGLQTIMKNEYNIDAITFTQATNTSALVRNRKIFIDNVDIFISVDGFYPFLEILREYDEIYISCTSSDFYKKITNESISSVFLENIQGVKINTLIPDKYAKMIKE